MPAVKREIVLERERRAWELRQAGWTQARIADELGVDQSTVARILARLSARYLRSLTGDVAAVKGAQIAQLEAIADEALQGWRRSVGEIAIVTRKSTVVKAAGPDGAEQELPGEEVTVRTEDKAGAPEFLRAAMEALASVRKILGLDAPAKVAATDPEGNAVPVTIVEIVLPSDGAA